MGTGPWRLTALKQEVSRLHGGKSFPIPSLGRVVARSRRLEQTTSPGPAAQGDATLPWSHWVAEDLRNLMASAPERPAHH